MPMLVRSELAATVDPVEPAKLEFGDMVLCRVMGMMCSCGWSAPA
jgi:hypothetical protein